MNPQKFARIAESLRQYRRAELKDFQDELGQTPVDALYVDALPNDAILNSVLSTNTTFLLGRKGTGKSTVFARAQSILRTRRDFVSTYIDVKSLYDIVDASDVSVRTTDSAEIDSGICRAHLLRKAFLARVISELLREVEKLSDDMSRLDRWLGRTKPFDALKQSLSKLQDRLKQEHLAEHEYPILQQITRRFKSRQETEHSEKADVGGEAKLSLAGGSVGGHASLIDFDKSLADNELYKEYSDVVLRSFPFDEIIAEIQLLLDECGLKRIVVFFDDFSELGLLDQRLFVDVVLAPLNNSSREAVKLKVAGYPGRVYYGRIDATKVDTINLDFAALYEATEVQTMEFSAIDYATRLLQTRFAKFDEKFEDYFDPTVAQAEYMKLMFETTFNVPRLMGAILHTCYLDRVSKDQKINPASIRLAARKYYEATIAQYFDRMNRFALEPFENKLDRHNQRELLRRIVDEARSVRKKIDDGTIGGTYFQQVNNPPTSHFIVNPEIEELFASLESNFLVSKYKDTRDKDGKAVLVYALYFGLVESERLSWGYPPGRDYRNYFVQRCFDFTSVIHGFLAKNQTIRCAQCGKCYSLDQRDSFELFKWRCPECRDGLCAVVNLADDYQQELSTLGQDLLLEGVELNILSVLDTENRPMAASEISVLIDETYQLVGRRTSKLRDKKLVHKESRPSDGKTTSIITKEAKEIYFSSPPDSEANDTTHEEL